MLPTIVGFILLCTGIALTFSIGWACIVGGAILFVAGAIDEARKPRRA